MDTRRDGATPGSRTFPALTGIATLTLVLGLWSGGCATTDGGRPEGAVLRFSAIPDENLAGQVDRFRPVAEYLTAKLGIRVEYYPVETYDESVQAFREGTIQAAWFGGFTGVQARRAVPDSRAVAQGLEDPAYFSYFIANRHSGIEPDNGFPLRTQGMRFAFGSPDSTSGRVMPEFFIRQVTGRAPEEFYETVGFSGNHSATIRYVDSGSFDVGVVNHRTYDRAAPADKANTVVLWKTPVYPDYNLTIRPDLDETFGSGVTQRFTTAFLAMPQELVDGSFGRSKMIPAENADFERIAAIADGLGLMP